MTQHEQTNDQNGSEAPHQGPSAGQDLLPPFRQRWPWIGADAQTFAFAVVAKRAGNLDPYPAARFEVDIGDGSGDRLAHELNLPTGGGKTKPLVIVFHGLGGHAEEGYVRLAAKAMLAAGHPVLRYNNRGCGIGRDLAKTGHWPGDTGALRATFVELTRHHPEHTAAGVFLLGFSLGVSLTVIYLAEAGETGPVIAAAAVSGPLDLAMTSHQLEGWRTLHYRRYIVGKMKYEILRPALTMDAETKANVVKARTVWQFDEAFNAPRHGFDSAADFYAAHHLGPRLPEVRVPLLMLVSRDDPFVPFAMYEQTDWAKSTHVTCVSTAHGGHTGFHGKGDLNPWCNRLALEFFRRHMG